MDTKGKADTVSHMDQESTKKRRPKRSFSDEFKAGAVRLVLEEGKTVPQVARDLDLPVLEMAIGRRCLGAGLLHHSDQGCTYASEDYQKLLTARGIDCSMSRRCNPYDNAVMESWNSTFKVECGERFLTNVIARTETFEYIEVFYNQKRIHSAIGYVSPAAFERKFLERQAA